MFSCIQKGGGCAVSGGPHPLKPLPLKQLAKCPLGGNLITI